MFGSPSILIISCSFISVHVLGMAVPRSPPNLQSVATEYWSEITAQDQVIEDVQNLLKIRDEVPEEEVPSLCTELIESYYRQLEPRNRMVEIAPTDNVLDYNSLEYLVTVASRYAKNVMHLARQIREDPINFDSTSILNELIREHRKTQIFDKLLLDLADVSQRQQSGDGMEEDILPLGTNDETVLKDNEVQAAVQNESSQGSNVSNIAVTIQEDVETTTTHKVVTSYVESLNLS